jgi:hypothetical protein
MQKTDRFSNACLFFSKFASSLIFRIVTTQLQSADSMNKLKNLYTTDLAKLNTVSIKEVN